MWPSYVINLADNRVRMANSAAALDAAGLPFERIEAVNGWTLPDEQVARVYDAATNRRRGRRPLIRPEIGCYLSHIEAWRAIADGPAPGGFIFEDDFQATGDLAGAALALAADGGRDWDMVKLFSLDPAPRAVRRRRLDAGHELIHPFRVPTCLIAYGLTRAAAARLAERAIPFFRPVDEDQKFFWETGLSVALVVPPPITVGDQQAVTGTIGNARRAAGGPAAARGIGQAARGLYYQLRYHALLRWHRARGHRGMSGYRR